MSGETLSTTGLSAIGATLVQVNRGGTAIGRVRRLVGHSVWEFQPAGWSGWTGDYRLMRDAIAALGRVVAPERDA